MIGRRTPEERFDAQGKPNGYKFHKRAQSYCVVKLARASRKADSFAKALAEVLSLMTLPIDVYGFQVSILQICWHQTGNQASSSS